MTQNTAIFAESAKFCIVALETVRRINCNFLPKGNGRSGRMALLPERNLTF